MGELSPLMQQYLKVKEQNKDTIVFFRVGDFYEMFYDDAKLVSKELELTLTGKECGQKERAPMCGVPFHSADTYIAKLVSKGYKVGICEQVEDPATAKGLVKREIIRIVTPGTVMEALMLDSGSNNFISAIYTKNDKTGAAFCDVSTGEFFATILEGDSQESEIKNELTKYSPAEILIGGDSIAFRTLSEFIRNNLNATVSMPDDTDFSYADCKTRLLTQFHAEKLEELGEIEPQTVSAAGVLLRYLQLTQMSGLERINRIELYREEQFLRMDYRTRRNLELTESMNSKYKKACLLGVLDKTKTPMGKRMLKSYIEKPLISIPAILRRQNAVSELYDDVISRGNIRTALSEVGDMERILTRVIYGSANAKELRALCESLKKIPDIKISFEYTTSALMTSLFDDMDMLEDLCKILDNALVDDPPFSVREGGMFRDGYSSELDDLRYTMQNGSAVIASLEAREQERTGIPKLRTGFNRVFGYYIEVSNSYKDKVPEDYIRKQTLVGGERYITQELKELEKKILSAKERISALEYEMLEKLRRIVSDAMDRITRTSRAIAVLDAITSLAQVAFDEGYTCPNITNSGVIRMKESRHPVVESLLDYHSFVPNDIELDNEDNNVAIITGPNMAGKSTYMRQVAIIVLMAQIGSFVPALNAEISVVDSIFTRIGASDDLSSGQSTFMVEMNEVSYILKHATKNSLIILDEIGRGTSTYDGMSIARAVLEYVADKKTLGAKTLFATHYHELTVLEQSVKGIKNYNIAAIKRGNDITFLRKILPGPADESYGVEVAGLAGLPGTVLERAKKILKELESSSRKPKRKTQVKKAEPEQEQLTLIKEETEVEKRLRAIDINKLTPMESMNILFELIKLAK